MLFLGKLMTAKTPIVSETDINACLQQISNSLKSFVFEPITDTSRQRISDAVNGIVAELFAGYQNPPTLEIDTEKSQNESIEFKWNYAQDVPYYWMDKHNSTVVYRFLNGVITLGVWTEEGYQQTASVLG